MTARSTTCGRFSSSGRGGSRSCWAIRLSTTWWSTATPTISWRVENPFRFFKDPADTNRHRATYDALSAVERLTPILAGEQQLARLARLCGDAFADQTIHLEHETEGIALQGWIALPTYNRSQPDQQYWFVNGRSISDRTLTHAARHAYRDLDRRGCLHPEILVPALPDFSCDLEESACVDTAEAPFKFPTLFELYLRYGARAIGAPAIDRTFGTIDFLLLLDTSTLNAKTLASILR